jgi:hypothetical protein
MDGWIVIPNWEKFQHYRDRDPRWIKNHRSLLTSEEYLDLSPGCRSILHGLWLVYASSDGQLRLDTRSISSHLRMRVTMQQLKRLNDAGFIQVSASKPLALRYQLAMPEKEKEKEQKSPISPFPDQRTKTVENAKTVLANTGDIERALDFVHNQPRLSTFDRMAIEEELRNEASLHGLIV